MCKPGVHPGSSLVTCDPEEGRWSAVQEGRPGDSRDGQTREGEGVSSRGTDTRCRGQDLVTTCVPRRTMTEDPRTVAGVRAEKPDWAHCEGKQH